MRHLVLFDLDGTLVDSFADIASALERAFNRLGWPITGDLLAMCRGGAPLEDFYLRAHGRSATDTSEREHFAAFAAAYRDEYLPRCLETTRPYPGVLDGLAQLLERAVPPILAIATTKRTETATRIATGTGLSRFVKVIAGSDNLPAKPHPAVLHRAAQLASSTLEGAMMVGDTDRDINAAHAAGITAVAVSWGGLQADVLRAHRPHHVIDRFEALLDLI